MADYIDLITGNPLEPWAQQMMDRKDAQPEAARVGDAPQSAIPVGMKPWAGGDRAPEDWDGGRVMLRSGWFMEPIMLSQIHHPNGSERWNHKRENGRPELDIVAYTPLATAPASSVADGRA